MLGRRRRRQPNIKPALGQHLVFACIHVSRHVIISLMLPNAASLYEDYNDDNLCVSPANTKADNLMDCYLTH